MKAGKGEFSIDVGSASDWINVLMLAVLCWIPSVIVGGIIGFVFRGRFLWALVFCSIASIALFFAAEWLSGGSDLRGLSPNDSYAIAELFGAFSCLFWSPSIVAALFVNVLWSRRRAT